MEPPDPQEVLKLAADIVSAKEHLNSLQSRWDALFMGQPIAGRKARTSGIATRVLAVIEESPDEHFDASLLQKKLGIGRKPIERALNNLFVAEKIARHSRGNYEAIQKEGESALFS